MKDTRTNAADHRTRDAILRTDFASFNSKVFQTLSPSAAYYDNWHIHAMAHQLEQVRLGRSDGSSSTSRHAH